MYLDIYSYESSYTCSENPMACRESQTSAKDFPISGVITSFSGSPVPFRHLHTDKKKILCLVTWLSHDIPMRSWIVKVEHLLLVVRKPSKHLIKYVEVSLIGTLHNDSRLFEKILLEAATKDCSFSREKKLKVLAKSWAVVVHHSLCITKCFKNRRYLNQN